MLAPLLTLSLPATLFRSLVRCIVSLNCFGCPVSSRETILPPAEEEGGARREMERVVGDTVCHSCGVWPTASYINHSCRKSATRAFIGDVMIVRATRGIPTGSEVTFRYQPPGAGTGGCR